MSEEQVRLTRCGECDACRAVARVKEDAHGCETYLTQVLAACKRFPCEEAGMVAPAPIPEVAQQPTRTWACPECHYKVDLTQEEIAAIGVPFCPFCRDIEGGPSYELELKASRVSDEVAAFHEILALAFKRDGVFVEDDDLGADFIGDVCNILHPFTPFHQPEEAVTAEGDTDHAENKED